MILVRGLWFGVPMNHFLCFVLYLSIVLRCNDRRSQGHLSYDVPLKLFYLVLYRLDSLWIHTKNWFQKFLRFYQKITNIYALEADYDKNANQLFFSFFQCLQWLKMGCFCCFPIHYMWSIRKVKFGLVVIRADSCVLFKARFLCRCCDCC